jgi:hypothetical protein
MWTEHKLRREAPLEYTSGGSAQALYFVEVAQTEAVPGSVRRAPLFIHIGEVRSRL